MILQVRRAPVGSECGWRYYAACREITHQLTISGSKKSTVHQETRTHLCASENLTTYIDLLRQILHRVSLYSIFVDHHAPFAGTLDNIIRKGRARLCITRAPAPLSVAACMNCQACFAVNVNISSGLRSSAQADCSPLPAAYSIAAVGNDDTQILRTLCAVVLPRRRRSDGTILNRNTAADCTNMQLRYAIHRLRCRQARSRYPRQQIGYR